MKNHLQFIFWIRLLQSYWKQKANLQKMHIVLPQIQKNELQDLSPTYFPELLKDIQSRVKE